MKQSEWNLLFDHRDEDDHPCDKQGKVLPLQFDPDFEWIKPVPRATYTFVDTSPRRCAGPYG